MPRPASLPGVLIAAAATGAGKTTATVALLAALRRRGLTVQPFKAGPDYIDGGYHALAAGRPSRNLDAWILPPGCLKGAYAAGCAGAAFSVVEGVMGLFDGVSPAADEASSAAIARSLGLPVLLVVDAARQSRSAVALVEGFARFDTRVRVRGVILNNASPSPFTRDLAAAITERTGLPVVGRIPPNPLYRLPERHLGLVPAWEHGEAGEFIEALLRDAPSFFDLEAIRRIAATARLPGKAAPPSAVPDASRTRIGYAFDEAFRFYYAENLELLGRLGARMVPFSPLSDTSLPDGLGALYFGGGFPEMFAGRLAANRSMIRSVREAIRRGMPVYAECGGLMYLAGQLKTPDGAVRPMCGILPGTVEMTDRLQHFGYKQVRNLRDTILAPAGAATRGHEFHHSRWDAPPETAAYAASDPAGKGTRPEGYARGNILASYVHLHFHACPDRARRLVAAAQRFTGENGIPSRARKARQSADRSTTSVHRSIAARRARR